MLRILIYIILIGMLIPVIKAFLEMIGRQMIEEKRILFCFELKRMPQLRYTKLRFKLWFRGLGIYLTPKSDFVLSVSICDHLWDRMFRLQATINIDGKPIGNTFYRDVSYGIQDDLFHELTRGFDSWLALTYLKYRVCRLFSYFKKPQRIEQY